MIVPRLALDFTSGSLDPRVTFTRALNTATCINSSGYIAAVSANNPRFDYNPFTLACKGLLIEESRQNGIFPSEDFSGYLLAATTVSTNQTSAPDNAVTADKILETSADNYHNVGQSLTAVDGQVYTLSVYAKKAERDVLIIYEDTTAPYAFFNLSTGTVTNVSDGTARIEPAPNGFYRCSLTYTQVGTSGRLRFGISTGFPNFTYVGDPAKGLFMWGAQWEAGAFPTSYIPTTSASATRNADVATITGANFSSWWMASQGGVTANFRLLTVSGTRPIIQYDDGTANEIITLRGNTTNPELYIVDGGAPQAQIDAGTIAANTDYSLTGWWQTNDCRAKLGSGAQVIDNTATIPTVTQARIGSDGTNYLNGHIASISYYDSFTSHIYNRRKNKAIFSLM